MSKGEKWLIDEDQCRANGWIFNQATKEPIATLILAHGAGAPMDSDFMQSMAQHLAVLGVNVLRFEFPYMAQRRAGGGKRPPNPQAQLLDAWRSVYVSVREQIAGPLAIGGKSMGGRMASLVADELGADALICLGYPFYAVGKPQKPRVEHLVGLKTPTLIIQGERDALGNRQTVENYKLSEAVELHWLASADHDLKPLKVSGFVHEQYLQVAANTIFTFLR